MLLGLSWLSPVNSGSPRSGEKPQGSKNQPAGLSAITRNLLPLEHFAFSLTGNFSEVTIQPTQETPGRRGFLPRYAWSCFRSLARALRKNNYEPNIKNH